VPEVVQLKVTGWPTSLIPEGVAAKLVIWGGLVSGLPFCPESDIPPQPAKTARDKRDKSLTFSIFLLNTDYRLEVLCYLKWYCP
jgi:hypothetical protein